MNLQIQIHTDDIFKHNYKNIVHGCNCFNTMGKGIAKTIAKKFPCAKEADQKTTKGDRFKLGSCSSATCNGTTIHNFYSQYTYWDESDMFSLPAYRAGLNKLITRLSYTTNEFAMPAIGLGLAKGNPKEVFAIFDELKSFLKSFKDDSTFTIHYHLLDKDLIEAWNTYQQEKW